METMMATHAYRRGSLGALISITIALAIGSAPVAALIALSARMGGVQ
jgi:hypothetical protein